MAAAHDGDEDGGDDDGGAEHDQVVLERDDHRGDCMRQRRRSRDVSQSSEGTTGEPA